MAQRRAKNDSTTPNTFGGRGGRGCKGGGGRKGGKVEGELFSQKVFSFFDVNSKTPESQRCLVFFAVNSETPESQNVFCFSVADLGTYLFF